MIPLITCENVVLSYDDKIIVKDLNFNINEGDYLCIVGENGSGKSTLMRALLGLKSLSGGMITYGEGLKQTEIGYLPQQTAVQRDFPASVFEVVLSGCLSARGFKPFYSSAEKKLALENMERLKISEFKGACYRNLSGGQQQRVLLARALCATRKMLLLDEPVTGLDPIVSSELYCIVKDINKQFGITVVMISHDIHSAADHADHILHLGGDEVFFGTTDDYVNSAVGRAYLGGHHHD